MKQLKEILQNKLNAIERLKPRLEKSLSKAPETVGSLVLSTSHGVPQYYLRDSAKKKLYLKKDNLKLITTLAQKEYDLALEKEIIKQEKQIKKILKQLPSQDVQDVYYNLPIGRKLLVNPHFLTDDQFVERWLGVKYEGKPGYDKDLLFPTDRGEKVRSKSEKIIADKLYSLGIPYRYEYPIYLKGYGTIYIDFVILDVKSRKEIYHEHFGKMDDPDYCKKSLRKLQELAKNGYCFIKGNLIATFESSTVPFDITTLEETLQHFLT